jgi:hypothetical protein
MSSDQYEERAVRFLDVIYIKCPLTRTALAAELRAVAAELERDLNESGAALREAAAAFVAEDRERLRLILCDRDARTRAHELALDAERQRDELRATLDGMLRHSCVADAGADMKDAQDHEYERAARKALEASK